MKETSTLSLDCSGSIMLGLMFVVLSIVCIYDAETVKKKNNVAKHTKKIKNFVAKLYVKHSNFVAKLLK